MDPKQLCLRVNQEIFGAGDMTLVDDLIAADFVNHAAPPGAPDAARRGPESIARAVEMIHSAFSDIRYEAHDIFSDGDKVALRVTMHGTHTGSLMGRPPTGRSFSADHIHLFRVADGKIAEHWAQRDDLGMMRQLGLSPS